MGSGIGKIRLQPVLLAKGETQLALYGLGNLRDERLARMFQTPGCVEWCALPLSRSLCFDIDLEFRPWITCGETPDLFHRPSWNLISRGTRLPATGANVPRSLT